jgi:predicted membrane channel-forming protein YqfA (hemolysin III family)
MTPRELVNRRLRRFVILWLMGWGVFAVGPIIATTSKILSDNDPKFILFMLPGLAMILGIFFYVMFVGVKCPRCRVNLAPLALYWPSWRGLPCLPAKYKFCPCCARSFDQPLDNSI